MELDISGTGLWAAGTAVVAGFLALCIVSSGRKFRTSKSILQNPQGTDVSSAARTLAANL
jgi:hypothetical protein